MSEEAYTIEGCPNPDTGIFINKKHLRDIMKKLHNAYSFDYDSCWQFEYDESLSEQDNFQNILSQISELDESQPQVSSWNWKAFFDEEGHVKDIQLGLLRYTRADEDEFLLAIHPYVEPGAYMFKTEKSAESHPRLKINFDNKSDPGPEFDHALEIYNAEDAAKYLLCKFPVHTTLEQILTTIKLKQSLKNYLT